MGMSERRPPRALGQFSAEPPAQRPPTAERDRAAGPTIVGGQPPARESATPGDVPLGLEQVLYTAAVDPGFYGQLLQDRQAAVAGAGIDLRPSEQAMLAAISPAQLRAAVSGVDTSPRNLQRRSFLRSVAAGALTVTAVEALQGCSDDAATGIRPQVDAAPDDGLMATGIRPDLPGDSGRDQAASRGMRPDLPPPGGDSGMAGTGIRPDLPPLTPDQGKSAAGGSRARRGLSGPRPPGPAAARPGWPAPSRPWPAAETAPGR